MSLFFQRSESGLCSNCGEHIENHIRTRGNECPDNPTTKVELHVFHDGESWVIASSPADAEEVCKDDGIDGADEERWEQLDDSKILRMWCDENGDICDIEGELVRHTCAEWVALKGRCYLGSRDG